MVTTVFDCERVQTEWFSYRAESLGGRVWSDGPLDWTDGPDGVNLMFPRRLDAAALARGVDYARASGATIVGAWLGLDVDARALADAGFERGWSPWWMSANIAEVERGRADRNPSSAELPNDRPVDLPLDLPVVELQRDTEDFQGDDSYRSQLALTRLSPQRAWYAAAYSREPRRFAGRAWSFLDGDAAGIFDMNVWRRFQRRGYGTALLRTVCAIAASEGAVTGVLNATPEGKPLYESCGFRQLGEGITWWLHFENSRNRG